MISHEQLENLKELFTDDGVILTNAQALEVGLWLIARMRPIIRQLPLDKIGEFDRIRNEVESIRKENRFANLYEWRRKRHKNKN